MDDEIRIENWVVHDCPDDPFCAPERRQKKLSGQVYNYPGRKDGDHVMTSFIRRVEGTLVVTSSGRRYRLGTPSEGYRRWLEYYGYGYNPAQPIKSM